MDVTVTVRHGNVPPRFRAHLQNKVSKVGQFDPRCRRVDAVVRHEANPRLAPVSWCLELTLHGDGPVIRAEASADEPYAALDLAFAKLVERLRRMHDRKVVRHSRRLHRADAVETGAGEGEDLPLLDDAADGYAALPAALVDAHDLRTGGPADEPGDEDPAAVVTVTGDSPISIREKTHAAAPMSLEQAMYEMELVGHDFFLFVDERTGHPSVVYRRRGWSYGVIRLVQHADAGATPPRPREAVSA